MLVIAIPDTPTSLTLLYILIMVILGSIMSLKIVVWIHSKRTGKRQTIKSTFIKDE